MAGEGEGACAGGSARRRVGVVRVEVERGGSSAGQAR
jgi:hypothetical protein